MNTQTLKELILSDIENSKDTKNIKLFISNIHNFSSEELKEVLDAINDNIYLGQYGVDDIAWFNLKKLIKMILA